MNSPKRSRRALAPLAISALALTISSSAQRQEVPRAEREPAGLPPATHELLRSVRAAGLGGPAGLDLEAVAEHALRARAELGAPEGVQAAQDPAPPALDHWDRDRFVPRPNEVAIRYEASLSIGAMLQLGRDAGLPLGEVTDPVRPGWTFVSLGTSSLGAARKDGSLQRFLALEGVHMVAPILESPEGWVTPSDEILMRVPGSEADVMAELLEGRKDLVLLESHFAGLRDVHLLRTSREDGDQVLELIDALGAHPKVAWAEPNGLQLAVLNHVPNDPEFPVQWALRNTGQAGGTAEMDIRATGAWDTTFGSTNVQVLVLDTGTDAFHPDLNLAAPPNNPTGIPMTACDGHGTAVAGCIASRIDNSLGVAGIAPNCGVLSARVITEPCSGSSTLQPSHLAAALMWGQTNGAEVSNSSFHTVPHSTISDAYRDRRLAGMSHFAAAGNDGGNGSNYPGSLPSVKPVGAIDRDGDLADFGGGQGSRKGCGLIFAPGKAIRTLDRVGTPGYATGDLYTIDGTSFASPYVAGVAALIRSVYPNATPDETEAILEETTTELSSFCTVYGDGLVNAEAAVAEAIQRRTCTPGVFSFLKYPASGTHGGLFNVYSNVAGCSATNNFVISDVPPDTDIYIFASADMRPYTHPLLASGQALSLNAVSLGSFRSFASGRACIANVNTCIGIPIFVQATWIIPGTATLAVSNVVLIDPENTPNYQVGGTQTFGRIGDAIFASAGRILAPSVPIVVNSGTYDEAITIGKSIHVSEAPGATAVLRSTGSHTSILRVTPVSSGTHTIVWDGIDIIGAGTYSGPLVDLSVNVNSGTTNVTFQRMRIDDAAGVVGNSGPVIRAKGAQAGAVNATLYGVDHSVRNHPWGPLFAPESGGRIVSQSLVAGPTIRPAGSHVNIVTTCSSVARVDSIVVPDAFILQDATVDLLSPRDEMFDLFKGVSRIDRCHLRSVGRLFGIARTNNAAELHVTLSVLDGRAGSTGTLIEVDGPGTSKVTLTSSAVLFDAAQTSANAAIRAGSGGTLDVIQCTIHSVTSHPNATAIAGPRNASLPLQVIEPLRGRIHGNVFVLPGSNDGVVRAVAGSLYFDVFVENIRHCPGGFPVELDQLPGRKLDEDPALVANGFHLAGTTTQSKYLRSLATLDIDGQNRLGGATPFGCDHVTAPAQTGRHVGVGQLHTTIQSAIQAASPGETIIVHSGNYNERIVWSKAVNIVEAWGETAALVPTGSAPGHVIHQTAWPSGAQARWEGIDVVNSAAALTDVIRIDGGIGGQAGIEFRACAFSDGPSSLPGINYFRILGMNTSFQLNGALVSPETHEYQAGFRAEQSSYCSAIDSYVSFKGGRSTEMLGGAQFTYFRSLIEDRGSEIGWAEGNQSQVTFYRSVIRGSASAPYPTFTVGRTGTGAASINLYRSVVDIPHNLWLSAFVLSQPNQGTIRITNSGITYRSTAGDGNSLIDATKGGAVYIDGSTIHDVLDEPQYAQFANIVNGPAQAGAVLTGSFNFNIFDIPGTTRGVLRRNVDGQGTPFGQLVVSVGSNVVNVGGGNLLFDRLPYPAGQPFLLDPLLGPDGIHLSLASMQVVPQQGGSSLYEDLEGQSRGSSSYLGCDVIY